MFQQILCLTLTLTAGLAWIGSAQAQEIERGTLKTLDVLGKRLVVTSAGKERELTLLDNTQVLGAQGKDLAEKLKDFAAGKEIFFRARERDGKEFAEGLKLAAPGETVPPRGRQPQAALVKKLDLTAKTITLTVDGKDREFELSERVNVLGARGETLAEKFAAIKEGAAVRFLGEERDGTHLLMVIAFADRRPDGGGQPVSPEHKEFKPLTELGSGKYRDSEGGLYPGGKNERPAAHEAAGLKLAAEVRPRNDAGEPADGGKIVLLSIGMSNASQASGGFREALHRFAAKNPALQFVDGAQGGMTAEVIDDPEDGGRGQQYWRVVDERLKQAGVSRAQVQAVWIKQADAGPRQGFPEYAKKLHAEQKTIVQILMQRFPNLKLCYLSSRTYGGYATTGLNPEPYAYESGFGVKWLIEEQLGDSPALNYDAAKGPVKAPWLSWGPYLWANGSTKRADGFAYEPTDFAADGTHHSPAGSRKIGEHMLDFFRTDSTTKGWFLKP